MAIIRNYNDIESLITEKYIIEERVEKGFLKSKTVHVEELKEKRKDIYLKGKLISFEEIKKITSTDIIKRYGVRREQENGEYYWEIKEYTTKDKPQKIIFRYFNEKGDCYRTEEENYSYSSKLINQFSYKLQYNQQELLQKKETILTVKRGFNKAESHLVSITEYKYDINNNCIKETQNEFEDGRLQSVKNTIFQYDTENHCIKEEVTEDTIFASRISCNIEKGHRIISTTFFKYNQFGDCISMKETKNGSNFIYNYNRKYDLYNNNTECSCIAIKNGKFDCEVVWKYNIKYNK